MKDYLIAVLGCTLGCLICIPVARHITIPMMPWNEVLKFVGLSWVFMTPIFLLCTFLARSANAQTRRIRNRYNGHERD